MGWGFPLVLWRVSLYRGTWKKKKNPKKNNTHGLIACIPTLVPQSRLIGPDIVPMGGKEVAARYVKIRYAEEVGCYKIVVSADCSGGDVLWRPGRLGLEAEHGADVFLAFWDGEVTPVLWFVHPLIRKEGGLLI